MVIEVSVSDNGPGVAPDRIGRIFERFYRAGTGAVRPGSGLGLAIVYEIATAHHGSVSAQLNKPHGLRVELVLPSAAPSAEFTSNSHTDPASF